MKLRIILMWFLTTTVLVGISNAQPGMLYERWDTPGTPDIMLTETSTPDYSEIVSIAQWGVIDDPDPSNYRARLTGWIMPPVTGNYRFWIITDDNSRLWLSTNKTPANYAEIARESGWRNFDDWGAIGDEQVSDLIPLEAGKRYWIRGGYQEGGGGDHIQIAWASTEAGIADHTLITDADVIYRPHWAYDPDPGNGEFFRYSTDVTELAWTLPLSIADSNEPFEVTCDVLWFGTDPGGTPELLVDNAAVESVSLDGRADTPAHYYWRVDVYDVNGLEIMKTEGDLWTFSSARDVAMVFIDESDGSTEVNEQGPTSDTYTISLSMSPAQPVTVTVGPQPLDVRVNSGTDDAEEHTDAGENGRMESITSTDLELGREDAWPDQQLCGMRFNNVNIPNGATITSAYLEFTVDEADSGQLSLNVFGELSPDVPDTFTTAAFNLSSRPRTSAEVNWIDLPDWTSAMIGSQQQTPDISSIISEITGQGGWVAGNSLVLLVEALGAPDGSQGGRTAESYNGSAGSAPLLHIEYALGAPGDQVTLSPAVVVLDDTNWEGVEVTVTAVDDDVLESNPHMFTLANAVSSADAEWDAVTAADVVISIIENECGAWLFVAYDFDGNCYVDMGDLAMLIEDWLACTTPNVPGCVETYRP